MMDRFNLGLYSHINIDQWTMFIAFNFGKSNLKHACVTHKNQWGSFSCYNSTFKLLWSRSLIKVWLRIKAHIKRSYFFRRLGLTHLIHMDLFYYLFMNGLKSFGWIDFQWSNRNLSDFIWSVVLLCFIKSNITLSLWQTNSED